ncbi:hypothetical protein [Enterococcus casseliflavus]|jgi:hypothetical protein|uniref:hypothetical protein n=1 Tax=Enterococcus casseliflavus TaxID=37734 RepID=UPI00115E08B5|nr:hypothetical protein [Enterococcus casseliflavus]MBE6170380.1 hypothetical protein [Enterococcus casseliflavus]
MKKVILGTTFIASLLLAGGVNAFANTIPTITEPIEIEVIDGDATFTFNKMELSNPIQITEALLEGNTGIVEGSVSNVGGTLQNLTRSPKTVNISVTAPNDSGISIIGSNPSSLEARAIEVASTPETETEIAFTINRTFALLQETDDKPVITITAQDGTPDTGETPPL